MKKTNIFNKIRSFLPKGFKRILFTLIGLYAIGEIINFVAGLTLLILYTTSIILIFGLGLYSRLYLKVKGVKYQVGLFKPHEKIKITCINKGKLVVRKGSIISVDDKHISIKDKGGRIYQYMPSKIETIQKESKIFFIFNLLAWAIFLVLMAYASFKTYLFVVGGIVYYCDIDGIC